MAADISNPDSAAAKKFYVYLYRDPRPTKLDQPIYVGKGTAARGRAEFHWVRRAANPVFSRILRKIREASLAPKIEIVGWFDDEKGAFDLERDLIAKFGRRDRRAGTLANLTDGGDGASGHIPSQRAREASSKRLKVIRAAQANDPKFVATSLTNLASGRGSMRGPILRRLISDRIRAAKAALAADPERSARQSEQRSLLRRAAWQNPEIRRRYLCASEANKEAKSAAMAAHYSRAPESIAGKLAWMTAALEDPEFRAKIAAGKAKSKRDPKKQAMWAKARAATTAAAAAGNKRAWADPVKRASRLMAMKAARERNKSA